MKWWRSGSVLTAVAAGGWHTCGKTNTGGVKCWGYNGDGELGDGTWITRTLPVDVQGLASGVTVLTAGHKHTCVRLNDGGVKCWGENSQGQLGNNTTANANEPLYVSGLFSGITTVTAGANHACALTSDARLKCWGDNEFGQLGDGTNADSMNPVDVILVRSSFIYLPMIARHSP
jgi:alpha-tubulin suppressor-like RCC1 family protein